MSVKNMGAKNTRQTAKPDVKNEAGGNAYSQSIYSEYLKMVLMNVANNTYYVDAKGMSAQALKLHEDMYQESPEFMAKAAVYARKAGMRLQPIVALAVMAAKMGGNRPQTNKWVGWMFNQIIWTPGDLQDLFALFKTKEMIYSRNSFGNKKTGFAKYPAAFLLNMSEYHAIKYGSEGNSVFPLRDILRLIRPAPKTEAQKYLFMYLTDKALFKATAKEIDLREILPQVMAFEALKTASSEEDAIRYIEEGRLPHEVVTGSTKMTPKIWSHLLHEMPYFALCRNLVTLNRNNVFQGEALLYAKERLVQDSALQKSKMLPFQVLTALRMAQANSLPNSLLNALQEAFEKSLANVEALRGKTAIAVDVSGSMSGAVTGNSELRYCEVAGIFAGSLFKLNPDSLVIQFNSFAHEPSLNSRDSLMSLAKEIGYASGSTALGAPLAHLINSRTVVDNYVMLTDEQSYLGRDWFDLWKTYKQIAPNAKAVIILLAPYKHSVAPEYRPDIFHVFGWNDGVLKLTTQILNGGEHQIQEVWNLH